MEFLLNEDNDNGLVLIISWVGEWIGEFCGMGLGDVVGGKDEWDGVWV